MAREVAVDQSTATIAGRRSTPGVDSFEDLLVYSNPQYGIEFSVPWLREDPFEDDPELAGSFKTESTGSSDRRRVGGLEGAAPALPCRALNLL